METNCHERPTAPPRRHRRSCSASGRGVATEGSIVTKQTKVSGGLWTLGRAIKFRHLSVDPRVSVKVGRRCNTGGCTFDSLQTGRAFAAPSA